MTDARAQQRREIESVEGDGAGHATVSGKREFSRSMELGLWNLAVRTPNQARGDERAGVIHPSRSTCQGGRADQRDPAQHRRGRLGPAARRIDHDRLARCGGGFGRGRRWTRGAE